jgi:hypothetical protein
VRYWFPKASMETNSGFLHIRQRLMGCDMDLVHGDMIAKGLLISIFHQFRRASRPSTWADLPPGCENRLMKRRTLFVPFPLGRSASLEATSHHPRLRFHLTAMSLRSPASRIQNCAASVLPRHANASPPSMQTPQSVLAEVKPRNAGVASRGQSFHPSVKARVAF